LLDALPKGNIFNAESSRVNILAELRPPRPDVNGRRLVIHTGNARPPPARKSRAFCEENRPHLAVPPLYSPDLAPSDFFLFGAIKHCLQVMAFPWRDELLAAVHEIVGSFRD
jgi:hypothetical protein